MKTTKSRVIDKIIEGLKKAALELEEFQLQLALGKADAKDVYEKVKKEFDGYVGNAKVFFDEAKTMAKEKSMQIKAAFETLQLQLALGKADTEDIYEEQMKRISSALNELEILIRKNETADEYYTKLQVEIEKFKIKLDILKLRYKLNKLDAKAEFEVKKDQFSKTLSEIKDRLIKTEKEAENKWEQLKDEISDAYSNLKSVFVK